MKVVFIRHGKTPGNLLKQYIGRTDQPLSEEGKAELNSIFESEEFQERVKSSDVKKIIVSPMIRCKETAKILFPNADQSVKDGFREMDFGIFEEKSANELMETKEYKDWLSTHCTSPVPDGEDKEGFSKRCCDAFIEAVNEAEDDAIYFLVHGGTIMSVFEKYADIEKEYYQWYAENGHGYMADWVDGKLTNIEAV